MPHKYSTAPTRITIYKTSCILLVKTYSRPLHIKQDSSNSGSGGRFRDRKLLGVKFFCFFLRGLLVKERKKGTRFETRPKQTPHLKSSELHDTPTLTKRKSNQSLQTILPSPTGPSFQPPFHHFRYLPFFPPQVTLPCPDVLVLVPCEKLTTTTRPKKNISH